MENHLDAVIKYYDETRFDYNAAWFTHKNLSIHFGFYDEHASNHHDAVLNTNRYMAQAAGIRPGMKVLDAGCGVGGTAFWLAKEKKVEVTGITPVVHQVTACQQKTADWKLEKQVQFFQSSFLQTPFTASSFDIVWACESVCHAEQKQPFYTEAFRLLKPGGRLVMAEYMRFSRPNPLGTEEKMRRGFADWAIKDIDTVREHYQMAAAAGFTHINIRDCSPYVRVSFRNVLRHCRRWRFLGKILTLTGIRSAIQHGNLLGTIDICETFLAGTWCYALLVAEKPTDEVQTESMVRAAPKSGRFS